MGFLLSCWLKYLTWSFTLLILKTLLTSTKIHNLTAVCFFSLKNVLHNQMGNPLLTGQVNDKLCTFMMGTEKRNVFYVKHYSFNRFHVYLSNWLNFDSRSRLNRDSYAVHINLCSYSEIVLFLLLNSKRFIKAL